MGRLDAKVCAITGAASGIARGASEAFVNEGATVYLLDRNEEGLQEVADLLGDNARPIVVDVTSEESVIAAFDSIRAQEARFDVLYTCAAVQLIGEDGPVYDLPVEVWDRTHNVNLRGVFLCCKYGSQAMIAAGNGGSIINCGSPTGLTLCGADWAAYSSAKAGVMGLTRAMAGELADFGIRVNGIVPGTIITTLTQKLIDDPIEKEKLESMHPIGRVGYPEDMAGIAIYLASDESSFATGSHFHVDGGISVR
jgi:NAD(P)-dependent dehydrogenase (short-subunit alcohol dehydrogenase family)